MPCVAAKDLRIDYTPEWLGVSEPPVVAHISMTGMLIAFDGEIVACQIFSLTSTQAAIHCLVLAVI